MSFRVGDVVKYREPFDLHGNTVWGEIERIYVLNGTEHYVVKGWGLVWSDILEVRQAGQAQAKEKR